MFDHVPFVRCVGVPKIFIQLDLNKPRFTLVLLNNHGGFLCGTVSSFCAVLKHVFDAHKAAKNTQKNAFFFLRYLCAPIGPKAHYAAPKEAPAPFQKVHCITSTIGNIMIFIVMQLQWQTQEKSNKLQ